ncbi:hypothetical protein [Frankia sp. R82]|uniref:hypothetical protein n=1 Tax=Frankia sp. R82 TaxID=2950553 RepID=UPI002043F982|nr:hypothetical protein [Frankia sp. R82]MCM3882990.1 hypothetical protein [Frankia sp. R82]
MYPNKPPHEVSTTATSAAAQRTPAPSPPPTRGTALDHRNTEKPQAAARVCYLAGRRPTPDDHNVEESDAVADPAEA